MTRRWKWKESLPWKKDALRKILVTGVASLLLALLYGIIFRFSAQDAGQRRRDLPGEQDAEQSDDGKEDAGAPTQDGHDVLLSRLLR